VILAYESYHQFAYTMDMIGDISNEGNVIPQLVTATSVFLGHFIQCQKLLRISAHYILHKATDSTELGFQLLTDSFMNDSLNISKFYIKTYCIENTAINTTESDL
jgi:hypothetical protein